MPYPVRRGFQIAFFFALCVATYLFLKPQGDSGLNIPIPHFDKIAHFGIFLVLGALLDIGFKPKVSKNVLGLAVYGLLVELAQSTTGYREASFADFVADVAGVVAYFVSLRIYQQKYQHAHG